MRASGDTSCNSPLARKLSSPFLSLERRRHSSKRCLDPYEGFEFTALTRERDMTANNSPEDAKLAACGPREVTLYSRSGCHLCEEAKAAIAPLLREFGAVLREVNIDEDALLKERYGWDIPVIFIGTRKAAKHRVDVAQFRRQLEEAFWR